MKGSIGHEKRKDWGHYSLSAERGYGMYVESWLVGDRAMIGSEYKVLDKGFVRVVDCMGSDERVIQAARISYGREDTENAVGLINYLMRKGHTSVFEQPHITLHVKLPIFVLRQWGRHRTFKYVSMNEISGRYTEFKDEFYIPGTLHYQSNSNKQGSGEQLTEVEAEFFLLAIERNANDTFELYRRMVDFGIAKERARIILQFMLYTQLYMTVDLHNLLHFLKLRNEATAQYEIRCYADVIEKIVAEWCPVVYGAWENYVRDSVTFSAKAMEAIRNVIDEYDFDAKLQDELQGLGVSPGEEREVLESLWIDSFPPNDALIRAARRYKDSTNA